MLELKNISFKVKALDSNEEITILDDISFSIDTGKILVITGPNGGGKSTLAKIIMGIEKPTSGKIYFDGVDITSSSVQEVLHFYLHVPSICLEADYFIELKSPLD